MSRKRTKKELLRQVTNFRMWKSGKQWLFSSSTKSKWLHLSKETAQEVHVEPTEQSHSYQQVYGEAESDGLMGRLKVAGGLAVGLGISVMGGGLAANTSANTVEAPQEKKLTKEALVNQDSVGIDLSKSSSTTEKTSLSNQPSESQSDSATEAHSEIESKMDVGLLSTQGWSGKTFTISYTAADFNQGTNPPSFYGWGNAQGTMTFTLNTNGSITYRFSGTGMFPNASAGSFNGVAAYLSNNTYTQDHAATGYLTLQNGAANYTGTITGAALSRFYNAMGAGTTTSFEVGITQPDGNSIIRARIPLTLSSKSVFVSVSQSFSASSSDSIRTSNSSSRSLSTSNSSSRSLSTSNSS
ncbi:KxYKxGKxW signal peptide domain-containing protein, partial [Lactococcus petauri]|uniref:KxYKxGKxW signal peptide domain-containing protein n=1 Tax=Lactococcus petauri TaxID=1940789 RepID=UPI0018AAE82F